MCKVASIQNTIPYTWGDEREGWHLFKSDSLSVIPEKMPPGTSEQLHFHVQSQQLFYILSGIAPFIIEADVYQVNENESIHIPYKTKHFIAD